MNVVIQGQEFTLEDRQCVNCQRPFRAMVGSPQKDCSEDCHFVTHVYGKGNGIKNSRKKKGRPSKRKAAAIEAIRDRWAAGCS